MFTSSLRNWLTARWPNEQATVRVAVFVNLVMIVVVTYNLAQLTWSLIPMGSAAGPFRPTGTLASSKSLPRRSMRLAAQITRWHLFGESKNLTSAMPSRVRRNAPETQLRLELYGVVASDDPTSARAILAERGGDARYYATGDDLPGGAILFEILSDRIILQRAGRFETLRLPLDSLGGGTRAVSLRAGDGYSEAAIRALDNDLRGDPKSLLDRVRAQPVRARGKLIGYRLNPGQNREFLAQIGLQPGDVVTEVNGISLDDPKRAFQLVSELGQGEALKVQVLRGGKAHTMNLDLSQ